MILGIDPGQSGAFALYNPKHERVAVLDMPTLSITVNQSVKKMIDLSAIKEWLLCHEMLIAHVIMEKPTAMPKQGITSAFNFGWTNGGLTGLIVGALAVRLTLIAPATWKKSMKLTADKDACRLRASQLFPNDADKWTRKKDDGRAEAAMLAWYGHHLGGLR
jgi:crossover junction endodeoxyribonuclease RuvC